MKSKGLLLTFRQREILAMLLAGNEPMEISKLVSQYKLGVKSIRNDLKAVAQWVQEYGGVLSTDEKRVFLAIPQWRRQSLETAFENIDGTDYLCKNERVTYLLSRLLLASEPVTSISLCQDMKVSKPTILSDLSVVEEHLNRHNLILERKRGVGYWVAGEEYQIRQAMERRMIALLKEFHISGIGKLFAACAAEPREENPLYRFLVTSDYTTARQILSFLSEQRSTDIPEENLLPLAVALLVMLRRIGLGKGIQVDWPICRIDIADWPMSDLAGACLKQMGRSLPGRIQPAERHFLVYKLYQYGVRLRFPQEQWQMDLGNTVRHLLWQVEEQMTLQDGSREQFVEELYDYLDFILHRKQMNISQHDPLYISTKAAYPQLFLTAQKLAASFQKESGVALSQEEIGFLSLLLAGYRAGGQERRALIVCDKDDMVAKVLTRRIRNNVPGLEVEATLTLGEFCERNGDTGQADFVVATLPLPECKLPVFQVDPIVDYDELQRIRDFVSGRKAPENVAFRDRDMLVGYLSQFTGRTITEKSIPGLAEQLSRDMRTMSYGLSERTFQCREAYSRDLAMVLSRLSILVGKAQQLRQEPISIDTVLGLAIHLTLSMVLWENGGIYPSEDATGLEKEDPKLLEAVEDLLEEIGMQIGVKLPRSEAIPILQYLRNPL